jgi:molybdopterin converting factor small subunit
MKTKKIFIGALVISVLISSIFIVNAFGKGKTIDDIKQEYTDLKAKVDQKQKEILNAGETKDEADLDYRLKEGKKFKEDLKYLGELEAQVTTPKVETTAEKIESKFKKIREYAQTELESVKDLKRIEHYKKLLSDLDKIKKDYTEGTISENETYNQLEHFYDTRKFKK